MEHPGEEVIGYPTVYDRDNYALVGVMDWKSTMGKRLWDKFGNVVNYTQHWIDDYNQVKVNRYVFLKLENGRDVRIIRWIDPQKEHSESVPTDRWYTFITKPNGKGVFVDYQEYMRGEHDEIAIRTGIATKGKMYDY